MKNKCVFLIGFLLTGMSVKAQVKVGDDPTNVNSNAVLEIESSDKGLLLPRVSLTSTTNSAPLSSHVEGMKVYNTATVGDVTPGIYYNNGIVWVRLIDATVNVYNTNDTLTGVRTVTQNGNHLTFSNTQRTIFQNSAGIGINQNSGTGTRSSLGLSTNSGTQFWLFTDNNSATQMYSTGNATSLSIGTSSTINPTPINFLTSSGGVGIHRAQIAGDGRFNIVNTLSIGYSSQLTFSGSERLKVNGSIVTASSSYPDYVFENYFDGISTLKADYKFKSIYDTEEFIIKSRHLPGVTPASALEKTEEGNYMFNVSELSMQLLEKIEELYLHTIEQQKLLDRKEKEVQELEERQKEIENRLARMEALLLGD